MARHLRSASTGVVIAEMRRLGGGSRNIERRFVGQAENRGPRPRAGGALEWTWSRGMGARGEPQAERQREQFFYILGFLAGFC